MGAKKKTKTWGPEGPRDIRTSEWSNEWTEFLAAYGGPRETAKVLGVSYQLLWRVGVRGDEASQVVTNFVRMLSAMKGLKSPL
jgi:hypothetical protein